MKQRITAFATFICFVFTNTVVVPNSAHAAIQESATGFALPHGDLLQNLSGLFEVTTLS